MLLLHPLLASLKISRQAPYYFTGFSAKFMGLDLKTCFHKIKIVKYVFGCVHAWKLLHRNITSSSVDCVPWSNRAARASVW